MTLVIISNAILGAVVLVAIVGKLVWAMSTAHRDRFTHFGLIVDRAEQRGFPGA
jgi:hypothetical protein